MHTKVSPPVGPTYNAKLSCEEILGWTRGTGEGALKHWLFIKETHCFNISAPDLATPMLPSWRVVRAAGTAIKN